MKYINSWLIKIYQNLAEFIARIVLFNRNLPDGYNKKADVIYSEKGRMDIFKPEISNGKLPVIIYIHGGGWTTGSKKTSARQCIIFAIEGFLVLNVEYRLGPKYNHPAQLEDIGNVLKWLNKNQELYGADTDKIFFAGGSAGAHLSCLSACIATNDDLRKSIGVDFPIKGNQVAGSLLLYGGYNMESILDTGFFMIKTMVNNYTGVSKISKCKFKDQISPVHHITEDFPPAFITVGERDHLFSQSIELIEVLESKKRPYEKLLFDYNVKNAKHAFVNFYYRDCSKQAYSEMIRFLKKYSQ